MVRSQSKEDFVMALVAGATTKGADAMGTCVNTQLKRAKVASFDKATPGQVDAAFLKCEASAQQAFEKAGGVRHGTRQCSCCRATPRLKAAR